MRGVAGVEVTVKGNSKKFVTDAQGNFGFTGLAPGSYTLIFRAQKAKDSKTTPAAGPVIVAQLYAIKVDGTKQPTNQSANSDQLLAGVAVPVQVGAGAQVRGQVAAAQTKAMVWIAPATGSNLPGHWVPADSPEAKGHGALPTQWMKGNDVQRFMDAHDSMHQAGFGGGGEGR